jgi:putative membrane protein
MTDPDISLIDGTVGNELSSNRTVMAFTRTGLAAERTLMASIRTALSLISFGFTIHSVLKKLQAATPAGAVADDSPARFGLTLIGLGILVLIFGLYKHWTDLKALRISGQELYQMKLLHKPPHYKLTGSTIIAMVLLIIGLLAIARIAFKVGPF